MDSRTTALVTGANKGIGYEIAAGLGRLGWAVAVGARDAGRRDAAVQKLTADGVAAFGVPLDVTSDESVADAVHLVEERSGRLDVLVNNAGVIGGQPQEPTRIDLDVVRTAVETNVIGVLRVTNAFLPLLRRTPAPRIVNVSSSGGSLTRQSDPGYASPLSAGYSPSKSMVNNLTIQYAIELRDSGILVNAVCPGYVASDLNAFSGPRTPEQGAAVAIRMATLPDDGPSGGFFDDDGVVPW